MRASCLRQDRCELQFAVKELARRMQQPTTKNMQALKRLVRFLEGSLRCLVCTTDKLNSQSWAFSQTTFGQGVRRPDGRLRLRAWCLAGISCPRRQQVKMWSSSGEAEFHALTKSASRALFAVATAADVANVAKPRVRVDATASKAIASRRGVGRVRHLQTQILWVQEAVACRELTIVKVPELKGRSHFGSRQHFCLFCLFQFVDILVLS